MKSKNIAKIIGALMGIFLVGMGVSFNAGTMLGNDPIGIVYDGVRSFADLSGEQLGAASNIVNFGLIILLLCIGRRYVNIGTFIYILPYGFFVGIGTKLYAMLGISESLLLRSLMGVVGCLMLYAGVAVFIAMDIGLDPFTGLVMVIGDKIKWDYKNTKVAFDITMVIIGVILGGRLGIITLAAAFTAGPVIQWIADNIIKIIHLENCEA
ncbi:YczE/YyaS/YitT family protein [Cellulosilyticum sp. I15G10I2]|uniref:YczE/YyaS/YitT family protein n=1 Tax=Cellulosilyticum sp. I15G10I2 TaxID=1892843 RepID=UPI00085C3213|nr:hypothetical protein [Cellulosilyticum sp. I15G10I2]